MFSRYILTTGAGICGVQSEGALFGGVWCCLSGQSEGVVGRDW